ncbi:hypothetical protein RBSH_04275 [Rhodopirellula baltica SH28]|uniref:Uncharacterized protein n=1 Tax=Rhodopirellula baltica SH28 TaxID=993517 RepID=K5DDM1_RHOBT|nr:hypothetical protein RBSH_04275 [Rhodopirellula baltica SH28]
MQKQIAEGTANRVPEHHPIKSHVQHDWVFGGRREKLADDTRRLRISSYRTIKPYSR